MMCQYEANKIIQLLRYCSWEGKTEMTFSGLQDLGMRLKVTYKGEEQEPNEKYLVDLLRDAEKKAPTGEEVTKRGAYIVSLLNSVGFSSWDDWKNALGATDAYVGREGLNLQLFDDARPVVVLSESLEKQLPQKDWQWIRKSKELQVRLQKEMPPDELAGQLFTFLNQYSYIVWMLPVAWKDDPSIREQLPKILACGRIVPVWIDPKDSWSRVTPSIPDFNQSVIGGISGVLTSILHLEEKSKGHSQTDAAETTDERPEQEKAVVQHFYEKIGGIFSQGNGGTQQVSIQHNTGGTQHYRTDKS